MVGIHNVSSVVVELYILTYNVKLDLWFQHISVIRFERHLTQLLLTVQIDFYLTVYDFL